MLGNRRAILSAVQRVEAGGDLAHTILTITDNGGGLPLVTTAAAHGLGGSGSGLTIAGTTLYNGSFRWTVIDPTSFQLVDHEWIGDDTGGTWSI
jgi:hypothetical protein